MQHTCVCRVLMLTVLVATAATVLVAGDALAQSGQSLDGTRTIDAIRDITQFGRNVTSETTNLTKLLVGLGGFIGGSVLTVAGAMGKFESKKLGQFGAAICFFVAFAMLIWSVFGVG